MTGATTFAAQGADRIVITRSFDAPQDLVFAAWAEPDHLRHWLGRDGWQMTRCTSDARPGGVRRLAWRRADGTTMAAAGVYLEVAAPDSVVWTERYDGSPTETVVSVRLTRQDEQTTVTTTIRYPSTDARDAALATRMRIGFDASMTALAEHLRDHPTTDGRGTTCP